MQSVSHYLNQNLTPRRILRLCLVQKTCLYHCEWMIQSWITSGFLNSSREYLKNPNHGLETPDVSSRIWCFTVETVAAPQKRLTSWPKHETRAKNLTQKPGKSDKQTHPITSHFSLKHRTVSERATEEIEFKTHWTKPERNAFDFSPFWTYIKLKQHFLLCRWNECGKK